MLYRSVQCGDELRLLLIIVVISPYSFEEMFPAPLAALPRKLPAKDMTCA